jgi:hypothetical protein
MAFIKQAIVGGHQMQVGFKDDIPQRRTAREAVIAQDLNWQRNAN